MTYEPDALEGADWPLESVYDEPYDPEDELEDDTDDEDDWEERDDA